MLRINAYSVKVRLTLFIWKILLCYEEEIDDAPDFLSFINIASSEVQVMAKINSQTAQQIKMQSEGDKKLGHMVKSVFDLHCRSEHIML